MFFRCTMPVLSTTPTCVPWVRKRTVLIGMTVADLDLGLQCARGWIDGAGDVRDLSLEFLPGRLGQLKECRRIEPDHGAVDLRD